MVYRQAIMIFKVLLDFWPLTGHSECLLLFLYLFLNYYFKSTIKFLSFVLINHRTVMFGFYEFCFSIRVLEGSLLFYMDVLCTYLSIIQGFMGKGI